MSDVLSGEEPLKQLFAGLTEYTFEVDLGVADPPLIDYLSDLLVRFVRIDTIFGIRNAQGQRLQQVSDMLVEVGCRTDRPQRDLHRHIGDFTLFMAGLFPEYLKRLKTAELIYHKDFLVDYMKTGKRSYGMVAEFHASEADERSPLFRKLSENFEMCVAGLGFVRTDLDRMQNPAYRKAKDLLLN